MSASIDYPECPRCGRTAYFEQDNMTMETRMSCQHCGYGVINGVVAGSGTRTEVKAKGGTMKKKAIDKVILYKPEKDGTQISGTLKFFETYDRNWARLREIDSEAKSMGKILGRYISEPYADGAAHYQIIALTGNKAMIVVCTGLGDDWVIPYWGRCAAIDRRYAEESICRRDGISELFIRRTKDNGHK